MDKRLYYVGAVLLPLISLVSFIIMFATKTRTVYSGVVSSSAIIFLVLSVMWYLNRRYEQEQED